MAYPAAMILGVEGSATCPMVFRAKKTGRNFGTWYFVVDFNGILIVFSAILVCLFFAILVVFRTVFSLKPCYLVLLGGRHNFLKDS